MSTRDNILETALTLFNDRGFQNVGVRDIARELNISPGNLSYHFPRKEAILIELLEQFASRSKTYFTEYNGGEPSNERILILLKNIFHCQFRYRGVKIGNQFLQYEVIGNTHSEYEVIARERDEAFEAMFKGLVEDGHLNAGPADLEFLQAHISLFGRFWISEVLLLRKEKDEDSAVNHYLNLFATLLELFSTDKGKESINNFRKEYL